MLKKTEGNNTRGIVVVDDRFGSGNQGVNLPVLGWLSGGQPIEPYDRTNAFFQVSAQMLSGKKRAFCLQIRGNNLISEGLLDKDYIIIEEESGIKDGDTIVAILENGTAILKKFFKEATRVRLEPLVENNQPVYATRIQIQGKCVGIVRSY